MLSQVAPDVHPEALHTELCGRAAAPISLQEFLRGLAWHALGTREERNALYETLKLNRHKASFRPPPASPESGARAPAPRGAHGP